MAVTVTRTSSLFTDLDGDNVADPGDIVLVHILVQNTNATDILNLKVYDTQNGLTITDLNSVKITPVAFDDNSPAAPLTIVGNTPYIVTANALLGNDIDPDGPEASLTITSFANLNHVTVTSVAGGYQIVPETGYQGVASFDYFITDAQGLTSVSAGRVHIKIEGQVWYVDNSYAGANGTSDGSYLKPFTGLGSLNDDGTGAAGTVGPNDGVKGDDDVDGANDTIFVYNRGTAYNGGITLESGQKLYGDGHALTVNNFVIGDAGANGSFNSTINYSTYGVTLSTNNSLSGLNLNGTLNTAVGIQDGNGSVTTASGTLNIDTVSVTGAGQAVDIDQGGNLAVALTSLSTTGTLAGPSVQLAGTAASGTALISGSFTAGGSIVGSGGHGFQIGGAGPSSGGTIAVTYTGMIGSSATGSAVNIADRISGAGTVSFTGDIFQSGALSTSAGIALSNIADGTITFSGVKTINPTGGAADAIELSNVSGGTINFSGGAIDIDLATGTTGDGITITNLTGGTVNISSAVDIDAAGTATGRGINMSGSTGGTVNVTGGMAIETRSGTALHANNAAEGSSLNISGTNSLLTNNGGALVDISNVDTTGMSFTSLNTGAAIAGVGVLINNLDGGAFTTGSITINGTTAAEGNDGIRIQGGSSTNFSLGTVGVLNTGTNLNTVDADGIEINGAGNGTVTIDSISVQNTMGQGVEIVGATSAVTISAGSIGNTNDARLEGVLINGGNAAVTVGATVAKTTAGNVVEVIGHTGGAISFSANISATNSVDNGIRLTNNTAGSIVFGGNVTLTTGANDAVNFTNTAATGAAVSFTGGNLAITTTGAGNGIYATSNTIGAGSLTVTGGNNTISTANGAALFVDDVRIGSAGLEFKSVNVTDASGYGIFLDNTGTDPASHGGLTITGDAGNSKTAGGTIGGADNAGISISNARDIELDQITVQNGLDDGIRLSNVVDFTLTQSNITTNGNQQHEHGIDATNVTGTVRLTDVTLTNNEHEQLHYTNNAVTATSADIQLSNVDFTSFGVNAGTNGNFGSHGINLTADGASSMDLRVINGSNFDNLFSNSIQAQNEGTGTLEVTVTNATFVNVGASAINIAQNDSGTVRFNIYDNGTAANPTFLKGTNNAVSHSININQAGGTPAGAILEGRVHNNYIGTAAAVDSASAGGWGIRLFSVGSGTANVVFSNNVIKGVLGGIMVSMGEDTNAAHTVNATIFNNNVTVGNTPNGFEGIFVQAGTESGDVGVLRLDMHNNTAGSSTSAGNTDFLVRQRFQTTVELLNIGGSNNSAATVQNYLDNTRNNTPNGANGDWFITENTNPVVPANAPPGGGFDNTASVPQPTLPSPMLLNTNPGFAEPKDSPVVGGTPASDPAVETGGGQSEVIAPAGPSGSETPAPTGPTGETPGPSQGEPAAPPPVVADDGKITQAELDLLVAAAIERWAAAGATAEQIATMKAVEVTLTDMMGVQIGGAAPGAIRIDEDGAGYGWFVDSTPGDDSEFAGSGTRLKATADGGAAGRVDLLTVLMHELGHQIGLDDSYLTAEVHGLMYGYVDIGERRVPAAGEAAEADGLVPAHEAYLLSPLADVGTLPAGKSVDIQYQAVIDPFTNQVITPLSNTATAKGDNIADTNSNTNVTTIDTLTLGDRIFIDANKNGAYDAGEGVDNVALTLFADNGTGPGSVVGALDPNDTQLATALTAGGGLYSFANLGPGEYIVRVDAANFAAAAVLHGKVSMAGGADPDNNAENDDNGIAAIGGSVASQAITLTYNHEGPSFSTTVPGITGEDTNNTLDFGFITVNTAPTSTNLDGDTAQYIEGAAPVKLDVGTAATLSDNNANFAGGLLTVAIGAGADTADDVLSIGTTATVTLDAGNTVKVGGITIGTYSGGTGGTALTVNLNSSANAANVDDLLQALQYNNTDLVNPSNDARAVSITLVDGAGNDGGLGADTLVVGTTVNVTDVNDAPEGGTGNSDSTNHSTTLVFNAADFSTGFSDPDGNAFAGIVISSLPATGKLKLNNVDIAAPATITLAQLSGGALTFVPDSGTGPSSVTFDYAVYDDGGVLNSGIDTDPTPGTFTVTITAPNALPVIDLNAGDPDVDNTANYTENAGPVVLSSILTVSDSNDTDIEGATVSVGTGFKTGADILTVGGSTGGTDAPTGISWSYNGTTGVLTLTGTSTLVNYETILRQVGFESTSHTPGASRVVNWKVNDGSSDSSIAKTVIAITEVNDAPNGTTATILASEDSFRVLSVATFGFQDADSGDSLSAVTITAVNGSGSLYYDSDGSAGSGDPVAVSTFPQTYTAAELAAGKVLYKASANANGNALATIDFQVVDSAGQGNSTDPVANTLTINVTPVNDTPDITVAGPINGTEQTASALLTGVTVSDADLDAKNGGAGDYAGSTLIVSGDVANNANDLFTIDPHPDFTVDGSTLKAGGSIFATFSTAGNKIEISFTSAQTVATSDLVDKVIQSIRYTHTGDNPPALVQIVATFIDGAPGAGQGSGTNFDSELFTVNIAPVNDAPTVTAADTTVSGTEDTNLVFKSTNGNAITVADPDNASVTATLTVTKGTLKLFQTTGLTFSGDGTGTVVLTGSAANINAALEGLIYRGNLNYEGSDTLSIKVDDGSLSATQDVAITLADDGRINGDNNNNNITGTEQDDFLYMMQDGDDTVSGLGGNDFFLYGSKLTAADSNDGGDGSDAVLLQGDYSTLLVLGANSLVNMEGLLFASASDNRFGYSGGGSFSYNVKTVEENVADGVRLVVNAATLLSGENFTFNGSAESDGTFLVYGGKGIDIITGGQKDDMFFFADGGRWGSDDKVNGGSGFDGMILRGIYAGGAKVVFSFDSLTSVEAIGLNSVSDFRFDPGIGTFSYDLKLAEGNVGETGNLIVNGIQLSSSELMVVDGSAIITGTLDLYGGGAGDVLKGGAGADILRGNGGGDDLTGGGGADQFQFWAVADSLVGNPDQILDFVSGTDKIDLVNIDANSGLAGDQAFNFIGSAVFSANSAGELRAYELNGTWYIEGDVDGGGADFVIEVTPSGPLTGSDFLL